jgi:AcrR family transcriptional regulator
VPRNRRPRDREEKSAEIVAAAVPLFTEDGFDKTSLASVAKAAGVTTNTIYWYFDSKEALLIAVLDHLLADVMTEYEQKAGLPLVDRLVWVVDQLTRNAGLVATVHTLALTSAAVATWHDQFHDLTNALLTESMADAGVRGDELSARTRLGVFAIEGLLMHPLPDAEQRHVLRIAVAPPGGPSA